jgi:hypothetical protein
MKRMAAGQSFCSEPDAFKDSKAHYGFFGKLRTGWNKAA